MMVPAVGFEIWMYDSGFRVQGSGFRVQGSGFRVQGSRFRVWGFGLMFTCCLARCDSKNMDREL
jgi:hypothetical protein